MLHFLTFQNERKNVKVTVLKTLNMWICWLPVVITTPRSLAQKNSPWLLIHLSPQRRLTGLDLVWLNSSVERFKLPDRSVIVCFQHHICMMWLRHHCSTWKQDQKPAITGSPDLVAGFCLHPAHSPVPIKYLQHFLFVFVHFKYDLVVI